MIYFWISLACEWLQSKASGTVRELERMLHWSLPMQVGWVAPPLKSKMNKGYTPIEDTQHWKTYNNDASQ